MSLSEMPANDDVIRAIREGGSRLEEVMRYYYRQHPIRSSVTNFVRGRNGSVEDAEDVFQDGLRNLIIAVRREDFKGTNDVDSYLFGICKNIWFKKFRLMVRENPDIVVPELSDDGNVEQELVDKERADFVEQCMSNLGDRCRKVLELWNLDYSMQEIASEMSYKSEGMARKKKHECLKKLMQTIADKRSNE